MKMVSFNKSPPKINLFGLKLVLLFVVKWRQNFKFSNKHPHCFHVGLPPEPSPWLALCETLPDAYSLCELRMCYCRASLLCFKVRFNNLGIMQPFFSAKCCVMALRAWVKFVQFVSLALSSFEASYYCKK